MGPATMLMAVLAAPPVSQPPPALVALVATPAYQADIGHLFTSLPADVFQRCPALVSTGSQVTILRSVSFGADNKPVAGLWRQSFPVSGCGNDTVINLYFQGQPGGRITAIVGIPGATRADLTLQRDALQFVDMALHAAAPACTAPHIRTSEVDQQPVSAKSGWSETWTAAACGHRFRVPLTFVPDATGTVITAKKAIPAD